MEGAHTCYFPASPLLQKWDASATGLETVAKVTQSSRQMIIASLVITAVISVAVYLGPANPAPKPRWNFDD